MITDVVGNTITVGVSVGSWYSGKSALFSAELYNVNTQITTSVSSSFYEIGTTGDYAVQITPPIGTYFLKVINSDLYSDSMIYRVVVTTSDIDVVSTQIGTINTQLTNIDQMMKFVYDVNAGAWKMDGTQMVFYKEDNVTEVARFNFFDIAGNLTNDPANTVARERN